MFNTWNHQPEEDMYTDQHDAKVNAPAKMKNLNQIFEQEVHEVSESSVDDYKVELSPDQTSHFPITVQECSGNNRVSIRGTSGLIYLLNKENSQPIVPKCKWEIVVPKGRFIAARFEKVTENCNQDIHVSARDGEYLEYLGGFKCHLNYVVQPIIFSSNNTIKFSMKMQGLASSTNITTFYLLFKAVSRDGKRYLPAVMTSPTSGYVTQAGFGGKAGFAHITDASRTITVPSDRVVIISFSRLDLRWTRHCVQDRLELHEITNTSRTVAIICMGEGISFSPRLFNTTLAVRMITGLTIFTTYTGFKMDFSFHLASDPPVVSDNGFWNCSGSNYNSFKQHLHCNLLRECAGGEDEGGHCPFSNQQCNGSVALGRKCYTFFFNKDPMTWAEADQNCKTRGGLLAGMRTAEEREAVESIFEYHGWWLPAWVGLRKIDDMLPHMYWKLWMWNNGVVAYGATVNYGRVPQFDHACAYFTRQFEFFSPFYCSLTQIKTSQMIVRFYICEFDNQDRKQSESFNDDSFLSDLTQSASKVWSKYPVTECPSGHVTFSFLSCEPASMCGTEQHQASCTTFHTDIIMAEEHRHTLLGEDDSFNRQVILTVSMFDCFVERTTLPYSLVCDYVSHCKGASDEIFCSHGDKCHDFTCSSGQCFTFAQKCDNINDCLDRTDEKNCPLEKKNTFGKSEGYKHIIWRLPPPTLIDFDGLGNFTQRSMQESDPCPETHFRCSRTKSNCLPVYVRCNGVYDCPSHADEKGCDRYMCPGFYRCRESRICVHADHMCDGWPQCPQRDDELYCELTCPPECLCQGMAFMCLEKFAAREYPYTRYLDASYSKMKPDELKHNIYLIWLSLASCNITHVLGLTWPNVMYLDLSHNNIDFVSMDSFHSLFNLKTLILSENPFKVLLSLSACSKPEVLRHLDISKTSLKRFDSRSLSCYKDITHLNMSHCPLDEITNGGFAHTPNLVNLDIRGSPVSTFPGEIFRGLNRLKTVFAWNYKLCCKAILPQGFDSRFCFAPRDEVSSCDDLLKSNMFRGCLCMFAILSVAGNSICFVVRSFSKGKNSQYGFNVFVSNLTVADFLMGVYLVMVGVADEVYRGQYVWHEKTWKQSTACAVAGFLSLLSSEMSAFIICLITLDRFIVLTFPFTNIRFNGGSATVTCVLTWTVGVTLASVPIFPMTPRWEFYGQAGICIPLPVTRGGFRGYDYAFGVMILLNFVLFVLITIGQLSIYRSVRVNSMSTDNSRRSKDLVIARRLFTVAASDFFCWFPVGLLGLLSANDVPVSSEVSVAMAIFVLPLNSALNPFLYTFNMVLERRRKEREVQLIKVLEARIMSQKTLLATNCSVGRRNE